MVHWLFMMNYRLSHQPSLCEVWTIGLIKYRLTIGLLRAFSAATQLCFLSLNIQITFYFPMLICAPTISLNIQITFYFPGFCLCWIIWFAFDLLTFLVAVAGGVVWERQRQRQRGERDEMRQEREFFFFF